jgi:hypothetical protein
LEFSRQSAHLATYRADWKVSSIPLAAKLDTDADVIIRNWTLHEIYTWLTHDLSLGRSLSRSTLAGNPHEQPTKKTMLIRRAAFVTQPCKNHSMYNPSQKRAEPFRW